jgi:hypothetical protein
MQFLKKILLLFGLGMVAHVCNPSYSRGRDGEIEIRGQSGQKVSEIPILTNSWA